MLARSSPARFVGHAANPISLSDVFFRIGGAVVGKATVSLRINSNDVIGDHSWIWRTDHGNSNTYGWTINTAQNGLIVNGARVTSARLLHPGDVIRIGHTDLLVEGRA